MLRFKLFHLGAPVTLSDSLPMLERMGLRVIDERPHRVSPPGQAAGLAARFRHPDRRSLPTPTSTDCTRCSRMRSDASFAARSRTTISTGWSSRRACPPPRSSCCAPTRNTCGRSAFRCRRRSSRRRLPRTPASPATSSRSSRRASIRRSREGDAHAAEHLRAIEAALEPVDEPVRGSRAAPVPRADPRHDAHEFLAPRRRRHAGARFVSFKFDPSKVPGLPEPRPMFEIFVYSPRFEGVHLRGGKVARGGLRWSDRPEDFRTEVLGLVKAQMVKNIVIVPVGSKGGFVLKRAPASADRDAYMKEGVACYQDYLRALLDLTDNRVGDRIVPPPQVRRHDPDDPYLVVAADKGTATFSDYANAISREYGFWLGDAFASGGSAGYDHKAMGITARGAWESVKRHFREIGHRHADDGLHGRRHRRHVGRRVRQRHAAVAAHPAGRGVRPPAHLPRSESRSGELVRRARAAVQAAALVVGRLRREADFGRRRRPSAQRQVDRDHAGGQGARSRSPPTR